MSDYQLNQGDAAPDIECETYPEGRVKLSDFRGRWVILYFYPKDSTPGCTTESCAFRDAKDDFSSADAEIIGVSRDSLKSHANFTTKQQLNFTLISDSDELLCKAFDVIQMKSMYGRESLGVERSTFIINPQGQIAHLWRKVKVKEHVEDVLKTLKALQA
ncbi:MAG: thioredoxin-dependent thiol peroxidase [Zetaproteobacteria bacterium CG_4_9_14_3_um_filter_49_83]|nr:MAG: peroxiredoxin [Zetaproteobacteria bacterium CG1_02_49_23]PIQ31349.1 MAG: thioredoxin-dependent thiol peroxidase [Zetaproteobacteria bacterium CG17_big_fil_post_rev_8_21_14_2_50_50_13]PIV31261.1 MAG: thioredoxin-dependent thiol peroxidase [Zetaproteobacteria bacterium CG02_land_8_20_14_3_00_50_9]PIY55379.1 MAG: thioredoxin-dependent thiol peroxidase [Zetaproteobacteria bacterium CG_4_10_14_0_8_um_filter_49_80]PJA34929.1 MAG: thioredoxin-dependent thiol peroxidase [Zetaproteobacteria bact